MVLQLVEWLGSGTSLLAIAIAVVVLLLLRATKKKQPAKPTGFPRPRLFKRTPNLKVLTKKTGKQYLVIGGSGFLGSHLVEALLARGETRIRIFDLQNNPLFDHDPSVEFIKGNILNSQQLSKACQGVHVVFMPAALVDYWSRLSFQYERMHAVNVVGMENVIAACQENGVEKLIQTSSSAVLLDAKSLQHGGVDETTPYTKNPPGHYSRTKVLAEKAVLAANGKRGLSTIAIRPNALFGPRDGIMTELVYINGELGPLLGYTNKQDWIYIENVVHGHLCAEEKLAPGSPVAGKAYCISPDRPMSYFEFWKDVVKYMHAAKTADGSELVYLKPAVSYPLATIFEFVSWLTRGKLKAEALKLTLPVLRYARAEIYFNDSKARKELGYHPVYTMEESFHRLEEYYFPDGEEGKSRKERQH